MPSSSPEDASNALSGFIEEIAGTEAIRIDEDFGQGFVRLRSSEAERRQAAQDIRSAEDVVIELLRNSRDAGARNIYLATGKSGDERSITIIDDGCGIPENMHELIFQPRVTSKLDTAHMDKWGLHGRGMALFSIAENSITHKVVYSSEGDGTSIKVTLSTKDVSEKKDQSTFPYFDIVDGVLLMRGPKNILRTVCEFAIESRGSVNVYMGSSTEVMATLYRDGLTVVPARERIFSSTSVSHGPAQMVCLCDDPEKMSNTASVLGLSISTRSSRRILDDEIEPLNPMLEQIEEAMVYREGQKPSAKERQTSIIPDTETRYFNPRISRPDIKEFSKSVSNAFKDISEKYYLEDGEPRISIRRGKMTIEFDLIEAEASDS